MFELFELFELPELLKVALLLAPNAEFPPLWLFAPLELSV